MGVIVSIPCRRIFKKISRKYSLKYENYFSNICPAKYFFITFAVVIPRIASDESLARI